MKEFILRKISGKSQIPEMENPTPAPLSKYEKEKKQDMINGICNLIDEITTVESFYPPIICEHSEWEKKRHADRYKKILKYRVKDLGRYF